MLDSTQTASSSQNSNTNRRQHERKTEDDGRYTARTGAYEKLPAEARNIGQRDELDPAMLHALKVAGFSEAETIGQTVINAIEAGKRAKIRVRADDGVLAHLSPPQSTFGRVQSSDLVESMITAVHMNADTLGPGVYTPSTDTSFNWQSRNIRHKSEYLKACSTRKKKVIAKGEDAAVTNQNTAELWRAMKSGPSLPKTTSST